MFIERKLRMLARKHNGSASIGWNGLGWSAIFAQTRYVGDRNANDFKDEDFQTDSWKGVGLTARQAFKNLQHNLDKAQCLKA